MYISEDGTMGSILRLMPKVALLTSAYLVSTNPYAKVYFNVLMSQVSVLCLADTERCALGCKDDWTGMASVTANVAHRRGFLSFLSAPWAFGIPLWDIFLLVSSRGLGDIAESDTLTSFPIITWMALV